MGGRRGWGDVCVCVCVLQNALGPDITIVVVSIISTSPVPVTNFQFQAAVPKVRTCLCNVYMCICMMYSVCMDAVCACCIVDFVSKKFGGIKDVWSHSLSLNTPTVIEHTSLKHVFTV